MIAQNVFHSKCRSIENNLLFQCRKGAEFERESDSESDSRFQIADIVGFEYKTLRETIEKNSTCDKSRRETLME